MQCIWETGTEYKQTASSGDVYMLNPGVNKLTMKGEGQLFVMYNTELTSNTAKPIKIHIPLVRWLICNLYIVHTAIS